MALTKCDILIDSSARVALQLRDNVPQEYGNMRRNKERLKR
jgi:hypothetical protein